MSCLASTYNTTRKGGHIGYCSSSRPCGAQEKRKDWIFHGVGCTECFVMLVRHIISEADWISWDGDGKYSVQNIGLVPTDSPFNVRSKSGEASTKHDVFTREYIKDLVRSCWEVMPLSSHGRIFNGWLQFDGLYQTRLDQNKEVPSRERKDCEDVVVQKLVFEMETKPLCYKKALENFTRDPSLMRIAYTSVHETAVQKSKNLSTDHWNFEIS